MTQVFMWICLVLVASTSAYGLQRTATDMLPPAAAADQNQVSSATVTRAVLIVADDPVTGAVTQVECDAPVNSFAGDMVLVDAKDLPGIASTCIRTAALGSLHN